MNTLDLHRFIGCMTTDLASNCVPEPLLFNIDTGAEMSVHCTHGRVDAFVIRYGNDCRVIRPSSALYGQIYDRFDDVHRGFKEKYGTKEEV